ncbi:MAG TPA: DUF488 family protein [Candidatus Kapabacteria bacterium]|nr:DUF488 family protein [Candidatus Kapabacteria bacterium]
MICTSYFGNIKKLCGLFPISIARITPSYLNIPSYLNLAPTFSMLKMPIDKYLVEYNKILENLDPNKVIEDLNEIAGGKPFVLLCYEKPNEFCHRHLVSAWLKDKLNLQIEEWKDTQKDTQLTLF